MTHSLVRLERHRNVARIVLARPEKRNALSRELLQQLLDIIETLAVDGSLRLAVLSAEGSTFCAGMDLGEMEQRAAAADAQAQWQADTRVYRDVLVELLQLPIPILAVVDGPVVAGGLGILLACDLVLGSDRTWLSLPEPQRGVTAAVVTPLLVYRAGAAAASYLLLSGQRVSAANGLRMGILHEVTPTEAIAERQRDLELSILSGSKTALTTTKQHVRDTAGSWLIEAINTGMQISALARETEAAREGLAAFLEKRRPAWQEQAEQ